MIQLKLSANTKQIKLVGRQILDEYFKSAGKKILMSIILEETTLIYSINIKRSVRNEKKYLRENYSKT